MANEFKVRVTSGGYAVVLEHEVNSQSTTQFVQVAMTPEQAWEAGKALSKAATEAKSQAARRRQRSDAEEAIERR